MSMNKLGRIVVVLSLFFSLVGASALLGCSGERLVSSNELTQSSEQGEPAQSEVPESIEIQIFAPNSLAGALPEIQRLYAENHAEVVFADPQFETASTLIEILEDGSSADLLISDSKSSMDAAEKEDLVDPATRFDLFSNDLVIVAKEDFQGTQVTLQDIANGTYTVAVGDGTVPLGNYTAQAFSTIALYRDPTGKVGATIIGEEGEYTGITPMLEASGDDVCKKVESGKVDVAIVYASEVYRFSGVKIVGRISAEIHKPILYPVAVCPDSLHQEVLQEFLEWATTDPAALELWQDWGFELVS